MQDDVERILYMLDGQLAAQRGLGLVLTVQIARQFRRITEQLVQIEPRLLLSERGSTVAVVKTRVVSLPRLGPQSEDQRTEAPDYRWGSNPGQSWYSLLSG